MSDNPFATRSEVPKLGPAFRATFDSEADCCLMGIEEGEMIRADGQGGWVHADCPDAVTVIPKRLPPVCMLPACGCSGEAHP